MAYAYADISTGTAVSPFIGGAIAGSQPRMAGQRSPESTIFASATGIGGTSVMGANAPTRQEPGRNDRMDVPTMNHAVNATGGRINDSVETVGNGIGRVIDGAASAGQFGVVGASALFSAGVQNAIDGMTVSQSYSWPQAPEPQAQGQGQDSTAYLAQVFAMDQSTKAKMGMDVASFDTGALGGFSTPSVPDARAPQSAGMSMSA